MQRLADFKNTQNQVNRPKVPIVPMDLKNDEATLRLATHAAKRVIAQHKKELEKLAYR